MNWIKKYWYAVALFVFPITATAVYFTIRYFKMRDATTTALSYQYTPDAAPVDQGQANLQAFLMLIRRGESSMTDDAFTELFGGGHFDNNFVDHPRIMVTAGKYTSNAAGAFQILSTTWDWIQTHLHLPDFSPESQTKAAIWLITYRGGYDAIIAGDINTAMDKCKAEWASLPGSTYGQPTQALSEALAAYTDNGGTIQTA